MNPKKTWGDKSRPLSPPNGRTEGERGCQWRQPEGKIEIRQQSGESKIKEYEKKRIGAKTWMRRDRIVLLLDTVWEGSCERRGRLGGGRRGQSKVLGGGIVPIFTRETKEESSEKRRKCEMATHTSTFTPRTWRGGGGKQGGGVLNEMGNAGCSRKRRIAITYHQDRESKNYFSRRGEPNPGSPR